jgi:hypothetical protein
VSRFIYWYAECRYTESHDLFIGMLNVVILSVIMLSDIMLSVLRLNVVMLSVMAPSKTMCCPPMSKLFLMGLIVS